MKRLDLSIRHRLVIAAAATAVLIAVLLATVLFSVSRVTSLQHEQSHVIAPRVDAAAALERAVYRQSIAFRNYAITRSPESMEAFTRTRHDVSRHANHLGSLITTDEGRRRFAALAQPMGDHQRNFDEFISLVNSGGDRDVLRLQEAATSRHRIEVLAVIESLRELFRSQDEYATRTIAAEANRLLVVVPIVGALIIIGSLISIYFTTRSVTAPARQIVLAAEGIAEGSFARAVALDDAGRATPFRDELREAAHVFGRMASTLKAREETLASHARLSRALGSTLEVSEIASRGLREVASATGADVGAIYLAAGDVLRPVSTIALEGMLPSLRFGEGVPGTAASQRKTVTLRDLPQETSYTLRLGFADAPPRAVIAAPLVIKGEVLGVITIASIRDFPNEAAAFVEHVTGQLAIAFDNALSHETIGALARDLQEKNEQLQSQNEELQAQGEELQAQAEELQAQQEELRVQNDELQSQAEELRAQKVALSETNTALTRAEEQKDQFLALLGHELRNPLAAISGAVALLGREVSDLSDEASLRALIDRQAGHLARLVDDLLDVARITSGKITLDVHPMELGEALARCATAIPGDGPAIEVSVQQPVWITGDETRMDQVITNLLHNAVKFTPPDGRITVTLVQEGSEAVVRITDTGSGIDPSLLPRMWEPFVQGDTRSSGKKDGLGLGLPLVRRLVELHHGTAEATSAGAGLGSTFTIRIPAIKAPAVTVLNDGSAPRLTISRSVVVVDDNDDVRFLLTQRLLNSGHVVVAAADGPAAVETIHRVRPDIAIVDIDLPGFDGYEVARQIRRDAQLARTHLIALSGYGRPEDRQRALEAGFDQHLVKPVDFQQLTELLERTRPTLA